MTENARNSAQRIADAVEGADPDAVTRREETDASGRRWVVIENARIRVELPDNARRDYADVDDREE